MHGLSASSGILSTLGAFGALACAGLVVTFAASSCGSSDSSQFEPTGGDAGSDTGNTVTCNAPQVACGAVCVDIQNDTSNCGTCGASCGAAHCCAGICNDTASCALSVTRTTPKQGNQSGGDYITLTGNGFAVGMKVLIGDGVAPTRMIDAHTAIVQTPPGPVGDHDLTIVVGSAKATMKGGFRYVAAGLQLPWQEKPMAVVRGEMPGLAVLQDGRVLVTGGTTVPDRAANTVDTAEIYTRATDSVTNAKSKMAIARWRGSATTLLSGKALVVGGPGPSTVAELFDPATDSFKLTKNPLNTARSFTRCVLMADGRVMVTSAEGPDTEVYDPDTDGFTSVPAAATHVYGFVVRLRDGRVMLGGGDGGNTMVEIFDGAAWKTVAPLNQGRSMLTAHTLPDGRVMVVGGASLSAGAVDAPLDTIELYDPKTDKWTTAPYKLSKGRTWHASALVRDGTVIVMGGYAIDKSCTPDDSVDQVDPVKNTVKPFGTLPRPNCEWTAVTLQDGSVLGVGGGACSASTANPSLDFLPGIPITK